MFNTSLPLPCTYLEQTQWVKLQELYTHRDQYNIGVEAVTQGDLKSNCSRVPAALYFTFLFPFSFFLLPFCPFFFFPFFPFFPILRSLRKCLGGAVTGGKYYLVLRGT